MPLLDIQPILAHADREGTLHERRLAEAFRAILKSHEELAGRLVKARAGWKLYRKGDPSSDCLDMIEEGLRTDDIAPEPSKSPDEASRQSVTAATFEQAWEAMEAKGYQYGEDALEQVRFGWELATEQLRVRQARERAALKLRHAALRAAAQHAEMLLGYPCHENVSEAYRVLGAALPEASENVGDRLEGIERDRDLLRVAFAEMREVVFADLARMNSALSESLAAAARRAEPARMSRRTFTEAEFRANPGAVYEQALDCEVEILIGDGAIYVARRVPPLTEDRGPSAG